MRSATRHILSFVAGVILAGVVVRGGLFSFIDEQLVEASNADAAAPRASEEPASVAASEAATAENLLSVENVAPELVDPATDPGKRVRILRAALEEGTLDSLELVAEDFLKTFPDYESRVLPGLKEQALQSLLVRLSYEDRRSWPEIGRRPLSSPSEARIFVEDVAAVNPTLGTLLDTAALLFYGLERATARGEVFNERVFLLRLEAQTEELGSTIRRPDGSAAALLDTGLINEPWFIAVFERQRAATVARHVLTSPGDLSANIVLIHSVNPESVTPSFKRALNSVMLFLADSAAPNQRMAILDWEIEHDAFARFFSTVPELSKSVAELFMLGTLDAVAIEDLERSAAYIRESLKAKRGLAVQHEVLASLGLDEQTIINQGLVKKLEHAQGASSQPTESFALKPDPALPGVQPPAVQPAPQPEAAPAPVDKPVLAPEGDAHGEISWFFMGLMLLIFIGIPAGIMYAVNRVRVEGPAAKAGRSFDELEIDPAWNLGAPGKAQAPSVEGGSKEDFFGPMPAVDVRDIDAPEQPAGSGESAPQSEPAESVKSKKSKSLREQVEVQKTRPPSGGPKRKAPRTGEHSAGPARTVMPGPRRRPASAN